MCVCLSVYVYVYVLCIWPTNVDKFEQVTTFQNPPHQNLQDQKGNSAKCQDYQIKINISEYMLSFEHFMD